MVDTKSRGYSNLRWLSECWYLEWFLASVPDLILCIVFVLYICLYCICIAYLFVLYLYCISVQNSFKKRTHCTFQHYRAALLIPDIFNRVHVRELLNLLLQRLGFSAAFLVQVHIY